ncbi:hypothetical protein ACLOJK_029504 [Asimina triloba]
MAGSVLRNCHCHPNYCGDQPDFEGCSARFFLDVVDERDDRSLLSWLRFGFAVMAACRSNLGMQAVDTNFHEDDDGAIALSCWLLDDGGAPPIYRGLLSDFRRESRGDQALDLKLLLLELLKMKSRRPRSRSHRRSERKKKTTIARTAKRLSVRTAIGRFGLSMSSPSFYLSRIDRSLLTGDSPDDNYGWLAVMMVMEHRS